ncbi:PAC2 family protein [Arcanobacterium pinnipediorum]|uniref:PAC2 family protein n=1 Tax=Arcanobacterium pinnipediorum TaxID=1503041 RepID=A0ABY5ALD6_9ACTO|nr:PAC2 family protein [Arcanobacterium pinnipediorum]USR80018.1 PAC2 family protein [Arcanobacterium pinnipediorum]
MPNYAIYPEQLGDLKVSTLVIGLIDHLVDPGAIGQAVNACIDLLDAVEVSAFDSDPLYDYRAQRPIVTYVDGKLASSAEPSMSLDLVTDLNGESFLFLHGTEPDFHWPRLTADVIEIIKRFGVEKIFSIHGMPAPIPHTRAADMLIRTTEHVTNSAVVYGQASHPASLADYIEYQLGQAGYPATNIRVRVPLYMSRSDMPFFSGALAVVRQLAALGGPTIPFGDLEQHEDHQRAELASIAQQDSQFAAMVSQFETDYDSTEQGFVTIHDEDGPLPTSDEIGAAVEKFLAMQNSNPLEGVQSTQEPVAKPKPKDGDVHDIRTHLKNSLAQLFNRKQDPQN